jgi:hypothetical protein
VLAASSIGSSDSTYITFLVAKWRMKRNPALGRLFSNRCVEHVLETVGPRLPPELLNWSRDAIRRLDSANVIEDINKARCSTTGSEIWLLLLVDAYHKEMLHQVDADYVAWQAIELVAEYQTNEESNLRTELDQGVLELAESNWQWGQAFAQIWAEFAAASENGVNERTLAGPKS